MQQHGNVSTEELQSNYDELLVINERQEKQVQYHESRAQNLTTGYLILQGLYLTAISQRSPSSLQCKNWWVPFGISLFSSVIFFITFLNAVNKFYWTLYNLDVNHIDRQSLYARIRENKDGVKSHSKIQVVGEQSNYQRKPDPLQLFQRKLYIAFTVLALIAITAMELYACRFFLC
ncbi:hypothetical protein FH972_016331 [Carpinus fangiana]|uniref:Uncharacterized protein n=1 Tax=Carpinus fangiana TaxID=176857 RepID=A0A5N6RFK1_9ROSI|nr:hypothetical protein FH972_016331 [Carpinus fangiana]